MYLVLKEEWIDKPVNAIKHIREVSCTSLKEAKAFIDFARGLSQEWEDTGKAPVLDKNDVIDVAKQNSITPYKIMDMFYTTDEYGNRVTDKVKYSSILELHAEQVAAMVIKKDFAKAKQIIDAIELFDPEFLSRAVAD